MLVTKSYCFKSSRLLWFGPCSIVPNPVVVRFAVALMFMKSAILESMLIIAAHPPSLSISARRSSLNHTSAQSGPVPIFLTPTIKVRTSPKFGFPFIAIRCSIGVSFKVELKFNEKGVNSPTGVSCNSPSIIL